MHEQRKWLVMKIQILLWNTKNLGENLDFDQRLLTLFLHAILELHTIFLDIIREYYLVSLDNKTGSQTAVCKVNVHAPYMVICCLYWYNSTDKRRMCDKVNCNSVTIHVQWFQFRKLSSWVSGKLAQTVCKLQIYYSGSAWDKPS